MAMPANGPNSTGENKAGRYTLEFETSSDVSEVTIFAQAYRQQTAPVSIDDIQLAQLILL